MHQSVDAHPSILHRPTAYHPLLLIIKHSGLRTNVSAGPAITLQAALSSHTLLFFIIFFHEWNLRSETGDYKSFISFFATFSNQTGRQVSFRFRETHSGCSNPNIQFPIYTKVLEGPKPRSSSLHLLFFLSFFLPSSVTE